MILDADLLPEGWRLSTFGREMLVRGGLVDPREAPWADMILIAPNHVESGSGRVLAKETASEQGADSGKYLVRAGDLIYSKIRPALNKVAIADEDCLCSADMYAVVPIAESDIRFCQYYMLADPFLTYAALVADRVKMPKVNREELAGAPWLVPPPSDQRRIADYLDRETATIDTLIDKQVRLLSTLILRRESVIDNTYSHLVLRGGFVRLGNIVTSPLRAGLDESAPPLAPGLVRYVRTTDILGLNELRNEDFAVGVEPAIVHGADLRHGDILLTRSGSLGTGYVHLREEVMAYAGYLVRIRVDPSRASSRYVAWWTQSSHCQDQIATGATRSTIDNFSASKMAAMKIPLPPLDEQRAIADHLDRETAKIDALIAEAERFIELAQERRAALITAAVTGQLEIPAEESVA